MRPRSVVMSVVLSLVSVVFLLPPWVASAATFSPTNVTVAVDRNTVTQGWGETVTSTLSFCVPDAQVAGDSFTVTLPAVLANWPAGFSIADGTGASVIDVTISTASPAVATFTLTPYGAGVSNLCAIAKFGADSGSSAVGTYPLNYVIGTRTLTPSTPTLTVEPQPAEPPPTEPVKLGWFYENANQCRDTTTNCLVWNFRTAAGNRGLVTITDTAPAGWKFACVVAYAAKVSYTPTGAVYEDITDPLTVMTGYSCTPTQLTFSVDTSVLAPDQIYYFEVLANAAAPGGDGGVRYTNTAQVTEGQTPPANLSASTSSSYVGGSAEGDGIRIYKKDAAGNDANTAATAVTLPDGTTGLSFIIRNTGTTDLTGITVTDAFTQGSPPATVTGLTCNFSEAVDGAPTTGTTWAGPFPPDSGFTCSATLSGVQGYSTDVASVTATGNGPVTSSDPYVAYTPIVPKVSVGDYVWYDTNHNGLQDDNSPASGVVVVLKDAAGATVGTTTTDAAGFYWFTDLVGGAAYTLVFTAPDGYAWTTQNAGGVSDNNVGTDTNDSDVAPADGTISFTAPAAGSNNGGANVADNPTLDGGLVKYDLTLAKALATPAPYRPGQTVTYTLTPQNLGPATALAGWKVTDVLPAGLTATGISGSDSHYSCVLSSLTCTNDQAFPAGADLGTITVTATIDPVATAVTLNNLAYVAPAGTDVPETNPLGTPPTTADATPAFDATTTSTNNDANVPLTVTPYVSVGDYVWYDTNRDGQQTPGESPYVGMTVQLYAGTDTAAAPLQTAVTDENGYYSFRNLDPTTPYTIVFVKGTAETFTTQNATGDTSNSPTADLADSDADTTTGAVTFTTTATGANAPSSAAGTLADNPGIDAGVVSYNLTLAKAITSPGPNYEGGTVTYTLTPYNAGPVDALAGWSVTDLLPTGLTFAGATGMDGGAAYTCSTSGATGTCTAAAPLKAKQFGPTITVTATIGANVTGSLKNVAYVAPSDLDGRETVPLVVPTTATDTATSVTDNDAEATLDVASLVSVGDFVWLDQNRDGLQTAGEPGVAGVPVTLTDATGGTRTTTTDADGYYWFDDLTPGAAYTLTFGRPDGYAWTTADANGTTNDPATDVADSDAVVTDALAATGAVTFTAPTSGTNTVGTPGVSDNPGLDAGLVELVSVGDFTWVDLNRNGIQDEGEPKLSGVGVNLYAADGTTLIASTTTDSEGYYWFPNLSAGQTYVIEFVQPDGYTYTPVANANGTDDLDAGSDSDVASADGKVPFVAESTGDNEAGALVTDNPTIDAGFVQLVSIGDYVWYDRNRDGQQGAVADEPVVPDVVVNLYAADGTTLIASTTTDANGFYSFADLLAGETYVVEFVPPADTVLTTQDATGDDSNDVTTDSTDSDADPVTGRVTVVAPASGANSTSEPDNATIDAGVIELVSIGDNVWLDTNRDGLQSEGEPPVSDVVVNLYDAEGTLVDSTTTDAAGFYSFTDLIGGATYTVEFVKPDGTTFTSQNVTGGDDTLDSDAAPATGKVVVVAPLTGVNSQDEPDDPTIDAGLVTLVSVGDYVWFDTNRDGLQSDGEDPVSGVVVNLYDADGVLVGTTTTDDNGFYVFTDLMAGADYTIEFVKPADSTFTSALAGDDAAVDSDADVVTGRVSFTAPATGTNSATQPDDPTIDAGLVKYNLRLDKVLQASGTIHSGDQVSFLLTPHNDGPVDALAGWSVTEVLPSGLTLVSMSGNGYTCTGPTCLAGAALPAGSDGPTITVVVTVTGSGAVRNVAYVDNAPGDNDEVVPLGAVPPPGADTTATATDNDAQADLVVANATLPQTGTDLLPALALGLGLLLAGGMILLLTRRNPRRWARARRQT